MCVQKIVWDRNPPRNPADPKPATKPLPLLTFGVETIGDKKNLQINIFSIRDNKGPPISEHLWEIKDYISETVLGNDHRIKSWALIRGSSFTDLMFHYRGGQPFKLDISNIQVVRDEIAQPIGTFDVEHCKSPEIFATTAKTNFTKVTTTSSELFCLPCNSQFSKTGLLYCAPAYFNSPVNRKDFHFILADPDKLATRLRADDEKIESRFKAGFTMAAERGLMTSGTIITPLMSGSLSLKDDGKIILATGDVSLVQMAKKIGLTYLPVAISANISREKFMKIHDAIGYSQYGVPPAEKAPQKQSRKPK